MLLKGRLQIHLNTVGRRLKRGFFQCGCRFSKSALPVMNWSSAAATVLVATLALARKITELHGLMQVQLCTLMFNVDIEINT